MRSTCEMQGPAPSCLHNWPHNWTQPCRRTAAHGPLAGPRAAKMRPAARDRSNCWLKGFRTASPALSAANSSERGTDLSRPPQPALRPSCIFRPLKFSKFQTSETSMNCTGLRVKNGCMDCKSGFAALATPNRKCCRGARTSLEGYPGKDVRTPFAATKLTPVHTFGPQ